MDPSNQSRWLVTPKPALASISQTKAVKSHGLPVSLTDVGNLSMLTAGRHNARLRANETRSNWTRSIFSVPMRRVPIGRVPMRRG